MSAPLQSRSRPVSSHITLSSSPAASSASLSPSPSTLSPVPPRRAPARMWSQFVGGHLAKSVSRDDDGDHVMRTDDALSEPVTLYPPASLPRCEMQVEFRVSETRRIVPPAFYPGNAIPTVLTFVLDRDDALPHALKPALTMSLVGTLQMQTPGSATSSSPAPAPPSSPRTIICVSVSLAEGLDLWARDAQQAYARRQLPRTDLPVHPKDGLPGGTYSLPLTVQVPLTPRLPPSFCVPGASFAVTYALNVSLTCDDPLRLGQRIVLAEVSRPFDMMPVTMPTRRPTYSPLVMRVSPDFDDPTPAASSDVAPLAAWSAAPAPASSTHLSRSASLPALSSSPSETSLSSFSPLSSTGLASPRPAGYWTVEPALPTTAFSPTSIIPLGLRFTPPSISYSASADAHFRSPSPSPAPPPTPYQIFIRITLVRREQSASNGCSGPGADGASAASGVPSVLHEEELITRHGYLQTDGRRPFELRNILLPLMLDATSSWRHGFSTMLNVSPASPSSADETLSLSSTFHLAVTIGFLALPDAGSAGSATGGRGRDLEAHLGPLPPAGQFSPPYPAAASPLSLKFLQDHFPGPLRTLPLSLVVGSVSEPTGAMHSVRWSDLHLDRRDGREVGRMVHGEGVTCEDGWIVPPPSYDEACQVVPYDW